MLAFRIAELHEHLSLSRSRRNDVLLYVWCTNPVMTVHILIYKSSVHRIDVDKSRYGVILMFLFQFAILVCKHRYSLRNENAKRLPVMTYTSDTVGLSGAFFYVLVLISLLAVLFFGIIYTVVAVFIELVFQFIEHTWSVTTEQAVIEADTHFKLVKVIQPGAVKRLVGDFYKLSAKVTCRRVFIRILCH